MSILAAPQTRVPRVVAVLALSIFVLGTSEFMITGLLPEMARDLAVSIPQTGYLISAFAIGMIVGAPLMAVVTLAMPRRTTLVASLLVFVAGHVLAALASDYAVVLTARLVTALATATFWVVAAVVAVSTVGEHLRARALAVLLSGLTVATVLGVPLGTVVGQQLGWRATFWAVAGLALLGLVAVLATVPRRAEGTSRPVLRDELAAFRRGRLWLALGTTALYQAGALSVFAYVAPLLTGVAGIPGPWVPAVLFGYGLAALAGITVGGRLADAHPWATLFTALGAGAVIFAVLGLFAGMPGVAVVAVVLLGGVAFLVAAPLNARVFQLAGTAPTLASAANTTAFNVGNTLGPVVPLGWSYNPELGTIDISGRRFAGTRKFRNVAANPRVAFIVDDVAPPWQPCAVIVEGRGHALSAPAAAGTEAMIRITPEKIVSWGLDGAPPPRSD